jgi:hypothetical protein
MQCHRPRKLFGLGVIFGVFDRHDRYFEYLETGDIPGTTPFSNALNLISSCMVFEVPG